MTTGIFIDSPVLIYAVGADHPNRAACRELLAAAADSRLRLHASVLAIQEFLYHRLRRTERSTAVRQAREARNVCKLHPFDADVLVDAIDLVATTQMRGRDAVHAATAVAAGFSEIVTTDRDFAEVPGLRAIRPQQVDR